MSFLRFPTTPHLFPRCDEPFRADKVLAPDEAAHLLSRPVLVEEKVDGDNLGLSAPAGQVRAQHRGDYVRLDEGWRYPHLSSWLREHDGPLADALGDRLTLFGEWCAAVHSVRYDSLPDWFLVFDVYEHAAGAFWSTARRDALCSQLGLQTVPSLAGGRFGKRELTAILGRSRLGSEPMEGLVVRRDEDGRLLLRAKLVRPEFLQADHEHWRGRRLRLNRLSARATA